MANSQFKEVQSLEHLHSLLGNGIHEYAITLNGGFISRKIIHFDGGKFEIENCIDDTFQELTEEQLMDRELTHVGSALSNGALYYYE